MCIRDSRHLGARGTPHWPGGYLHVTTNRASSRDASMVAAAPARTIAVLPTYLLCCPKPVGCPVTGVHTRGKSAGFRRGVRNPYLAHYRPAFACSLFLYPLPCQVALRLPLLSSTAGQRDYHVPQAEPNGWFRSRLSAGGSSSASEEFGASEPDHMPFFWPKPISIFGLSLVTTFNDASPGLTMPPHPGSRPP